MSSNSSKHYSNSSSSKREMENLSIMSFMRVKEGIRIGIEDGDTKENNKKVVIKNVAALK